MFDIGCRVTIMKSVLELAESGLELVYSSTNPAKFGVLVGALRLIFDNR